MLPEAATFCAACGRRIAGWSKAPDSAAAAAGATATAAAGGVAATAAAAGGEEPTRQMEPTPSLLRAAAVSKQERTERATTPDRKAVAAAGPERKPSGLRVSGASGPVETDSALMRTFKRRRVPIVIALVCVAAGAAAGSYYLLLRHAAGTQSSAPIAAAVPGSTTTTTTAAPTPTLGSAVLPVPMPAGKAPKRRSRTPHRAEAVDVPSKHVKASAPGTLPHKADNTLPHKADNTAKPAKPANSTRPEAHPGPPPEDLPSDATPLTEAEQRAQAEASIDAAGVRLAVKQHLPQVKACYERAFKNESGGGTVEIAFAIDAEGRAARVRTESNSTDSDPLARCLEAAVATWKFPRPVGGEYELIYPFVFSPGS
jgi:hypothetical protein